MSNPEEKSQLTIEDLSKKTWYRTLKVLYIIGISLGIMASLGVAIDDGEVSAFFALTAVTIIVFEIFKRSFYYIYLGKVFPTKKQADEMDKIWAKIQTQIFPGGHKQTSSEIDEVSELLANKYPKKQIMQAYLHIVYLFFIAEDKSVERIINSTNIKMDNTIAREDIIKIYNYVQNKFLQQFEMANKAENL